jgi:hypothetical protein
MVISSRLPARGHRAEGKAAETVRLTIRLRFRWADLMPLKLNRTLTAVSDWVHLGEIVVIHAESSVRPPTEAIAAVRAVACRMAKAPI